MKMPTAQTLASIGVLIHALSALYTFLIFQHETSGGERWTSHLIFVRKVLFLDTHNTRDYDLLHLWMRAVQFRYVITDIYVFYRAYKVESRRLLHITLTQHTLESCICACFFFLHSYHTNSRNCVAFGVICTAWVMFFFLVTYFYLQTGE